LRRFQKTPVSRKIMQVHQPGTSAKSLPGSFHAAFWDKLAKTVACLTAEQHKQKDEAIITPLTGVAIAILPITEVNATRHLQQG
jgi:hypothetical protein